MRAILPTAVSGHCGVCRQVPALALRYGEFEQLHGTAMWLARFLLEGKLDGPATPALFVTLRVEPTIFAGRHRADCSAGDVQDPHAYTSARRPQADHRPWRRTMITTGSFLAAGLAPLPIGKSSRRPTSWSSTIIPTDRAPSPSRRWNEAFQTIAMFPSFPCGNGSSGQCLQ
jgi:hypothetical protein